MTQPAMTEKEWGDLETSNGHIVADEPGFLRVNEIDGDGSLAIDNDNIHALAALCLYGQPFGFTRGDVEQLRWLCDKFEWFQDEGPENEGWQSSALVSALTAARDIADRIESLLPPEDADADV